MRKIFAAICCLFLIASAAFTQSDRGTITGTISDPAGAMIPNASIEVQKMETINLAKTPNIMSHYLLSGLPKPNGARVALHR
jgi:multidrug efflux pump subunit AcrB